MRKLALVALTMLAACSDDGGQGEGAQPAAAVKLQPGQWEMITEITDMAMADKGAPALPMKPNTKVTTNSCITPEQVEQPQASLFAGSDGNCKYENFYMSNGRMNSSMTCSQPGMQGNVMITVEGKYTATSMDANAEVVTYLAGSGDMKVKSKLSGRRTGDCTPETEKATKT